jgi:hypothetical protein
VGCLCLQKTAEGVVGPYRDLLLLGVTSLAAFQVMNDADFQPYERAYSQDHRAKSSSMMCTVIPLCPCGCVCSLAACQAFCKHGM